MITIEVTAYNAKPVSHRISAQFGEAGGTIGRSAESTLVLLDPDRKISRTHATLSCSPGGFVLRDQGSMVPVMINGEPLGNGRESTIKDGDEIRIGGYAMSVVAAAPAIEASTPEGPAAAASDTLPGTTDMAAPVLSWDSAEAPAPQPGITTVILSTPEHGAPVPDAAAALHATPVESPAATSAPAPHAPPPDAAPAAPPTAPVPAVAANVTKEELMRALLAGAGLTDLDIPGGLSPQLMNQLGQILREATRGLLDLLAARANTKRQVRADMTVIVAKDNNPLKFSPGMEAALSHLLVPRGRGFMPPLRAVDDAYEDLRSHQLGFMAGMRSALTVVLARFDPKQLERRLTETTVVDSILPMHRKAKLWDLFGEHYALIAKEAESDFHSLFGQEFLKAYQAHAAKLAEPRAETTRR
jgi:FHA domain-containing protein